MKQWSEGAFFVPQLKAEAQVWVHKHGIDPADVPMAGRVKRSDDDHVAIEVFDRDSGGNLRIDMGPDENWKALTTWKQVQGSMPPSYLLEDEHEVEPVEEPPPDEESA